MDNVPTPARITLRSLKIAGFASHETTCFEANIYFDGKFLGTAENDGHGGSTFIHCGNDDRLRMNEAEAWAKTLPDVVTEFDDPDGSGGKFTYKMDLEHLVDDLVEKEAARKAALSFLRRQMKKKVLYIKDGAIWHMQVKGRAVDAAMIAECKKRNPGLPVINEMPTEQAIEAVMAASS